MTYEILSTRQTDPVSPTFYTLVKYNFDGVEKTIEVAQPDPKTPEELHANIVLRAETEVYIMEAAARQAAMIPEISLNTPTDI